MKKIEKIRLGITIVFWITGMAIVWYYSEWVTLVLIFIFQAIQDLDNGDKFKKK